MNGGYNFIVAHVWMEQSPTNPTFDLLHYSHPFSAQPVLLWGTYPNLSHILS